MGRGRKGEEGVGGICMCAGISPLVVAAPSMLDMEILTSVYACCCLVGMQAGSELKECIM